MRKLALRSFVVDRHQLLVEARRREVRIDRGRAARSHAPSRTFRERVRVVAQRYRHARPRVGQDSLCAANLGLGSSGLVPPFLGRLRWCFLNTKRKRDGRSKLRRSMCHTPRFVLSSWARACALTEGQRTAGAMAPHSRAPVEHRRARTRARVMPGRLSPASYDPGSSSDAPGAGPTRPGRAVGTELICLGMRTRASLGRAQVSAFRDSQPRTNDMCGC